MDLGVAAAGDGIGGGGREERGRSLALSARKRIMHAAGGRWTVPSATSFDGSTYVVDLSEPRCTCPDHDLRKVKCKHIHAVEFLIAWGGGIGMGAETRSKRPTYRQNWPAYNAAQVREQEHVEDLLAGLCDGIDQPQQRKGRPRLPLRALVFAAVSKVYGTMSGRRSQTGLRACLDRGLISAAPSYNSVFRVFESESLTPILKTLIEVTAAPLKSLERQFSQDSTGFSTSSYARWFDERLGGERQQHEFIKLHAFIGTDTNVVTAAEVNNAADCPMLEPLLEATVRAGFNVAEVSADKAYLSKRNVELIRAVGADPYIPFKDNSTGRGPEMWREMYAFYMLKRPAFLAHYHRRSNVETTFSMIKRKFGGAVRSKLHVAQVNEVLAKVLCHNLCCLVTSFYETGLKPPFWTDAPALRLVRS